MIASGRPLDDAIDIAQQASAIAVTRYGAQQSIPKLWEIVY
jgi:sugar/nucleoside kinase (ribokinase family)